MEQWEEILERIPSRLKEAREKKQLTKRKLAEIAGVSPQAITNYESNAKIDVPRLSNLVPMAQALEISLDWLCDIPFQNAITPAEALLMVLEVFQPQIEIINGQSAPYVTLSFVTENGEINSNEIAEFVKQYQLIQTVKEAGEKSNTDTTDTIKAIRRDLMYRYKDLPSLPTYNFLVNYESNKGKTLTPTDNQ